VAIADGAEFAAERRHLLAQVGLQLELLGSDDTLVVARDRIRAGGHGRF
jgi:hypothetical protein